MLRTRLTIVVLPALLIVVNTPVSSQSTNGFSEKSTNNFRSSFTRHRIVNPNPDAVSPKIPVKKSGLLINRLSPKDRERWKSFEKIVFATGKDGETLHPTIQNHWLWAEQSGHSIYIELNNSYHLKSSVAGSMSIETFDPTGQHHTAVIKLNLACIDQAVIGTSPIRLNGFIPFEKLRREERYVEVLGHELAHAQYILTSLVRSHLVRQLVQETNGLVLSESRDNPEKLGRPEMQSRITQRDEFLKELESQAVDIEAVVWKELLESQKIRTEVQALAKAHRP